MLINYTIIIFFVLLLTTKAWFLTEWWERNKEDWYKIPEPEPRKRICDRKFWKVLYTFFFYDHTTIEYVKESDDDSLSSIF